MLNAERKKKLIEEARAARMRRKKSARNCNDVTQQRQLDDQDNIQEGRYKTLVENIPCAIYYSFPDWTGPTTFISNKWKDWTGYSPEELYEDPGAWPKCIHPDDREKTVNAYSKACQDNVPYNLEYRVVHKETGQIRYVRDQGLLSKNEKGDIIRIDGLVTDITELKRTENELTKNQAQLEKQIKEHAAELSRADKVLKLEDAKHKKDKDVLRTREQTLRAFLNAPTESAILVDTEGTILDINSIAAHRLGKSIDELIGMGIYEYLPADIAEHRIAQGNKVIQSGKPVRFQDERGGHHYDNNIYPVFDNEGKVSAIAIFSEDITERKKTEEMLRKSEYRLREAQRVGAIGDWEFCVQTKKITWSEEVYRLFERDPAKGPPTFEENMAYYYPEDSKILKDQVSKAIDFGVEFDTDYHLKLPSGKSVCHRGLIRTVKDNNGKVIKLYGTVQDITERKRAEHALQESERKFRSLFEDAIQPIVVFDRDGVILMINPPGAENLKLSCKECVGRSIRELLPDLPEDSLKVFGKVIDTGKEIRTERMLELPAGHKWFMSILQPVYDASDTAYAVQVTSYDITERKQAEDDLKKSTEKYHRMEANIPGVVFTYALHPDGSHSFPYINEASVELFGIEPEDIIGDSSLLSGIRHPDDIEPMERAIRQSAETLEPFRYEVRHIVDGRVRWYDCMSRPQRQPNGDILWDGIMLEITERKQSEEKLQESEEKFRLVTENIQDVFWISTPGIKEMLYVSPAYEKIWGRSRESLYKSPLTFVEAVHPDDRQKVLDELEKHATGSWGPIEYRIIQTDGSIRWILDRGFPIHDEHNNLITLTGVATDITERVCAEQALKESEERFRAMYENALVGLYRTTPEGRILMANPALVKMLGYSSFEELAQRNLEEAGFSTDCPRSVFKQRIESEDQVIGLESCWIRRDGTMLFVRESARAVRDNDGEILYYEGTVSDITERKQAEEALRESEVRFRQFFENDLEYCYMVSPEGTILDVNRAALEALGYEKNELVGQPLWSIYADESLAKVKTLFDKWKSGQMIRNEELVVLMKDGTRRTVLLSAGVVRDETGKPLHSVSVQRDITELKQTEQSLNEREATLASIFRAAPIGIGLVSNRILLRVNDKICKMVGYSRDELIGQNARILYPNNEEYKYVGREKYRQIQECGTGTVETCWKHKDGRIIDIVLSSTVLDPTDLSKGVTFTALDITERKRAEEALRESEEKFRSLAEQSPNMIFINKKGRIVYANKKCEEAMGYKREEFYSPDFDFLTLIAPESVGLIKENFARHQEGKDVQPYDYSLINRQGERIEAINASKLIQYEGEAAILGIVTDITERKKAEQTLRESEERLKILFESAPDAIYLMDFEGRFVDGNIAAEELIGYEKSEVIGMSLADTNLMSAEHLSRAIANLKKATAGKPTGPNQYTLRRKDGSRVEIEVRTFPVKIGDEMLSLGMARDITERKRVEQKFIEYQAQLKTFASQLSLTEERERRRLATELHDQISQSLVISKIKLDQIRKSSASGELAEALEEVCNCLGQVIDDTRTLTFDLSSPILYELGFEAAVAEWLSEQIQEKHGIETEFEDDGQKKPLDDDIQALLFRNVRELLINVVKHAKAHKVKLSVRRIGEHILVSVEDDGKGFDPVEVMSTAAQKAKFGLFSIRERLEQSGGFIEIKSKPGRGSKITMTAPLKQTEGVRV